MLQNCKVILVIAQLLLLIVATILNFFICTKQCRISMWMWLSGTPITHIANLMQVHLLMCVSCCFYQICKD